MDNEDHQSCSLTGCIYRMRKIKNKAKGNWQHLKAPSATRESLVTHWTPHRKWAQNQCRQQFLLWDSHWLLSFIYCMGVLMTFVQLPMTLPRFMSGKVRGVVLTNGKLQRPTLLYSALKVLRQCLMSHTGTQMALSLSDTWPYLFHSFSEVPFYVEREKAYLNSSCNFLGETQALFPTWPLRLQHHCICSVAMGFGGSFTCRRQIRTNLTSHIYGLGREKWPWAPNSFVNCQYCLRVL